MFNSSILSLVSSIRKCLNRQLNKYSWIWIRHIDLRKIKYSLTQMFNRIIQEMWINAMISKYDCCFLWNFTFIYFTIKNYLWDSNLRTKDYETGCDLCRTYVGLWGIVFLVQIKIIGWVFLFIFIYILQ